MRRITIVGAGQSGLQLALALQQRGGYDVTLLSNKTADELRNGRVMSTQGMFDSSLQIERDLGLNFWENEVPDIEGIALNVPDGNGAHALYWRARLDRPAQSVDQRLKFATWLMLFEERGGTVLYGDATVADLERTTTTSDLVLVAAGKGDITNLFARNPEASPYDAPQRVLALVACRNVTPTEPFTYVNFNMIPGGGEIFPIPGLGVNGPCEFLLFEGIPGGPLDCWQDVKTDEEHLARSKELLRQYAPWDAERYENAILNDGQASLRGKFAPTVRFPVGMLPNGAHILGMADAVILNDPITGQGSNNAAKSAKVYYDAIVAHGDRPFTAAWMQATFDQFWEYAQYVTGWTNGMLMPPPPHVMNILGAASQAPMIAHRFVNGFNDPRTFFPWLVDPVEADKLITAELMNV